MSRTLRTLFVPVLVALMLCPDASGAQPRPRISLLPSVDYLLPSSYYAREFDAERSAGKVRIGQKALPLFGAQLSYELPGSSWRVGLGYARGESDLRVYHYVQEGEPSPPGGPPSPITQRESRYDFPATRELLTLAASRQFVTAPLAFELGTALIHQRLDATVYRGFLSLERVEGVYSDWGMQLGGSIGPSSGWARGLRVGVRGHLLRTSPELYDVFRSPSAEPEADADYETAFAASLGWRLTF